MIIELKMEKDYRLPLNPPQTMTCVGQGGGGGVVSTNNGVVSSVASVI